MSTVIICTLTTICIFLGALYVFSERQHARIAKFFEARSEDDHGRIEVPVRTRGSVQSAVAINAFLDQVDNECHCLEESKRLLFDDLASFSHDVRTPLAGVQGYMQLYRASSDERERAECVDEAIRRLDVMRILIDDLYDYTLSTSTSAEESEDDVVVYEVLAECLAESYPGFNERGWTPRIDFEDKDIRVRADPLALSRILGNVLTNCLKYGTDAPLIAQKGAVIVFANPVSAEVAQSLDINRVFDRFYRGNAARNGSGSGLGLATAKRLAESMGMRITARLEDNSFAITISLVSHEGK